MSEKLPDKQQESSDSSGDPRERLSLDQHDAKRKDKIYDDIIRMVVELTSLSPTDIASTSDIVFDLGLDSLQIYELVVDLEDGYDIRLPDELLEKIKTIADVVNMVYQLSRL